MKLKKALVVWCVHGRQCRLRRFNLGVAFRYSVGPVGMTEPGVGVSLANCVLCTPFQWSLRIRVDQLMS